MKDWQSIKSLCIIISITAFFIWLFSLDDDRKTKSYNTPANGDLNSSFKQDNSNPLDSTSQLSLEDKIQLEKNKLLSEGWQETEINNGQFPACYNFIPRKSKIDNYLQVQVGRGTDVAIKIMNIKTNKCVRYVFINSHSTFKVRNLPEGKYYLKIAYGKDWLSKIDNGKCVGKFIRNPFYEKGEDVLNYSLQQTSDGYKIPSYQLSLDVVESEIMNTFDSQVISEEEFNN